MAIPYRVTVKGKGNDIHVIVKPQPIATKEAYLPVITKRIQGIILGAGNKPNSILTRARLKHELIKALTDFHEQGMIKPKEGQGDENA